MNTEEQDKFMKNLSARDAIEIVGMTQEMVTAVKAKLGTLSEYEGECYTAQFKGDTK